MTDKSMSFSRNYVVGGRQKKRGSVDSALKPERKNKLHEYHRDSKKQLSQFVINLDHGSNKNQTKLSLNRNFTQRTDMRPNSNLCDLREEVEQLRMENESLREEIKGLRNGESEFKFQVSSLKKQLLTQEQRYGTLQNEYEQLEARTKKYAQKIKQLFENLIYQKRKNSQISQETFKIDQKIPQSPSNLSISNSLNLRKVQQQGYRDFYNSSKSNNYRDEEPSRVQNYHRFKKIGWSLESADSSPGRRVRGAGGETFGGRY